MRILYVSPVVLDSRTGDTEHVVSVCLQLARQGDVVDLIGVGDVVPPELEGETGLTVHPVSVAGDSAIELVRTVSGSARRMASELRPDVVYVRPYPLAWAFLLRHLRRDGLPYVIELNTFTAAEYKSKRQAFKGRLYEWFEGRAIRDATGVVTVTDELRAWAEQTARVRKPALVAGNGVDPERVPRPSAEAHAAVRNRLRVEPGTLVMAMAGFSSPWHGYDRAMGMLPHIDATSQLWLIGSESDAVSEQAEDLARTLGVADRVRIFPRLDASALAELLAGVDIGVGPLAFDRKDMAEAQPIKVRLYLASGLPVIYNHVDARLDAMLPFLSFVPSTDPGELAAGVEKLRKLPPNSGEAIRAYAVSHLSWAAVAAETREFLATITSSGPA